MHLLREYAAGMGSAAVVTPSTGSRFLYGTRAEVMLSANQRFCAVYLQCAGQATTAATDIVAWATQTSGTFTADTSGNQTYIIGLPITNADAAIAIGEECWVQTWGNRIILPDPASTVAGNNLLGDGSVAAGESIMAHASTDGMVDTWATDAGKLIGASLEADAPAITNYILYCFAGGF